jgi:hypothetical protein
LQTALRHYTCSKCICKRVFLYQELKNARF